MVQMFVDFSCPFCFVQSERLLSTSFNVNIEYCFVEHAPNVVSHANTSEQLTLLNEEFDLIVRRASDIEINKPTFCVNTRLAILYYLSVFELHPEKALEFRTAIYRNYWLKNQDISKPEVISAVLLALQCEDLQITETAISTFRATQNYWLNGDLEQRIPAIRSTNDGLLLGLQHVNTVTAFVEGSGVATLPLGETCKPDKQQQIALIDLTSLATLFEKNRALYLVDNFATVDAFLLDENIFNYKAVLFRIKDEGQVWQSLVKLKESPVNRYTPLIAIAELHSAKLIKQGYVMGASDVFDLENIGEYILPCLAARVSNALLLNTLSDYAQIDGLTQLWNKRSFLEFAQRKWRSSCRAKTMLSIVIMDIDSFKSYNDEYGHLTGDSCLQKIGYMLREALHRPDDIAARFGGEEFCLILPDTDYDGMCQVVERIQTGLQNLAIKHQRNKACEKRLVTLSFGGISCIAHPDHALLEILEKADQGLYEAKDAGRNQAKLAPMTLS